MINEYLDALDFRESELVSVQNNLQNSLGYDDEKGGFNNPVLKQELQKRIQQAPDKIIFSEFFSITVMPESVVVITGSLSFSLLIKYHPKTPDIKIMSIEPIIFVCFFI
jgi:hypothetical protein